MITGRGVLSHLAVWRSVAVVGVRRPGGPVRYPIHSGTRLLPLGAGSLPGSRFASLIGPAFLSPVLVGWANAPNPPQIRVSLGPLHRCAGAALEAVSMLTSRRFLLSGDSVFAQSGPFVLSPFIPCLVMQVDLMAFVPGPPHVRGGSWARWRGCRRFRHLWCRCWLFATQPPSFGWGCIWFLPWFRVLRLVRRIGLPGAYET